MDSDLLGRRDDPEVAAEPSASQNLAELARIFRRFGEVECRQIASPLYEVLSLGVADDPEILNLAATSPPGQPPPNLLYASVHYMLLNGVEHPLKSYYPDLSAAALSPRGAYDAFCDFCLEHWKELRRLISTRSVQTNVVRRSICLLPAFAVISKLGGGRPLAQIEIGASAGLNLLWEHYHYAYDTQVTWGSFASPVHLSTDLRGQVTLPAIPTALRSGWSVGVDLNPLSVTDEDALLWLRALVWPENVELRDQLMAAIQVAREYPPELREGDGSRLLPQLLASAPSDATLCVFASHALHQLPRDALVTLLKAMQTHSEERPVYFVSMEGTGDPHSELRLTAYEVGKRTIFDLANCHPHGHWLEWLHTL